METKTETTVEKIDLMTAIEIVKNGDVEDKRLVQFLKDLDSSATDALKKYSPDFLAGCISLSTAAALGQACVDEDSDLDPAGLIYALKLADNDIFLHMQVIAFKVAVGLVLSEGIS